MEHSLHLCGPMRSSPQSILVVEADRPLFRIAELVAPRASLRAKAIHNIACIDPCGSLDGDQDILNVSIQVGISKPCTDNIIYLGGITFGRARTRNWTSLNTCSAFVTLLVRRYLIEFMSPT